MSSDHVTQMREFRRILATITALAMLLVSKQITEDEFVSYLREAICHD